MTRGKRGTDGCSWQRCGFGEQPGSVPWQNAAVGWALTAASEALLNLSHCSRADYWRAGSAGQEGMQHHPGLEAALGHKQPAVCCLQLLIVCIFRFISCKFAVFCGLCKNL